MLCHPMPHTHLKLDSLVNYFILIGTLKLDTLVNYFIFECFETLTMKLLIETLVHTLTSFFHDEDNPVRTQVNDEEL